MYRKLFIFFPFLPLLSLLFFVTLHVGSFNYIDWARIDCFFLSLASQVLLSFLMFCVACTIGRKLWYIFDDNNTGRIDFFCATFFFLRGPP